MPILFAPPEPTGAATAAGLGYASAAAPFVMRRAELASQQFSDSADRALRAAAITQQGNLAVAGMSQNDIQQRFENQLRGDLAGQAREVSPAQQYAAQAQLEQVQRHAELQVWANGQEMTQAEALQLQRQKAAVAEIQNRPDWSQQEKDDAITFLRTKIDRGQQRYQATQQKHLEATVAQQQMATQHALDIEQRARENRNANAGASVKWMIDPNAQAALERELGPLTPASGLGGAAAALADRSKRLHDLAGLRGALVPHVLDSKTGDWTPDFSYKSPHAAKQEQQQKAEEHAMKLWVMHNKEYNAAIQTETDRLRRSHEQYAKSEAGAAAAKAGTYRIPTDEELTAQAEKNVKFPKPGPLPGMGGQPQQQPATGGGDQTPKADPREIAAQTRQSINARPLDPQTRLLANQLLEQSVALVERRGGYEKLSAQEKADYDNAERELARILKAAPPPAPPPAPGRVLPTGRVVRPVMAAFEPNFSS